MAAEPLLLDELIDRATDINNTGRNEEQALHVANQINKEIGGASNAVKILTQKLQLHQEVITLQVLNVVEVAVKNCGSRFHNEIGKYKFINELIKLLSPRYDADITPPSVKTRVIELLFSWYCGLPKEKKIAEAYRMLKQQGIIKCDPVDPSGKNSQPPPREEATVFTEDGNQQLLQTLLASTDPDDLHQANKLIKSMVKQEEERLDRVSKRVQDLETVSNNVKLLEDMLNKLVKGSAANEDLEIMSDLYETCLQLRPELFKLASRSADDQDDAMAEILCASDDLTRVIDSYKEKVLLQKIDRIAEKPYNLSSNTESSVNQSSLLDLDSPTKSTSSQQVEQPSATSGNSLLDEQFKLLGLDAPEPVAPITNNMTMGNQISQNAWQQPIGMMQAPMQGAPQPNFQQQPTPMQTSQQLIGAMRGGQMQPTPLPIYSQSSVVQRNVPVTQLKKKNDLLDFDVFSEFRSPTLVNTKPSNSSNQQQQPTVNGGDSTDGASQSALNAMLDISNEPSFNTKDSYVSSSLFDQQKTMNSIQASQQPMTANLLDTSLPPTQTPQHPIQKQQAHSNFITGTPTSTSIVQAELPTPIQYQTPPPVTPQTPPAQGIPNQEHYAVPLEALKPTEHPPTPVYDKNGLKSFLNIVTDTRDTASANVIVTVLSTISTSVTPVKNFSIQVAVPKVMRVKLQPATSTDLPAFNPILPPPSITQIMLIANPTKENVRLRFKVSYSLNGVAVADSTSLDQIAVR